MATDYLPIHTTIKSLAREMKDLIDRYQKKEAGIEELRKWLTTWDENCPSLVYKDEAHTELTGTLQEYLGKKRRLIVETILIRKQKL